MTDQGQIPIKIELFGIGALEGKKIKKIITREKGPICLFFS